MSWDKVRFIRSAIIDEFRSRMFWENELARVDNHILRVHAVESINRMHDNCVRGIARANEEIDKWNNELIKAREAA